MRIVAHTQYDASGFANNGQVELDLFGDENLSIRYEVDNIREANSKNSTYSKSYDIPATQKNNGFFSQIYDLNMDMKGVPFASLRDFNPYKSCEVQVYADGTMILDGVMFLNEIKEKLNEYVYNITIYSTTVGLLDVLGENTLADLDFEDIEHDFTVSNIQNSLSSLGVTLTAGGTSTAIMYPLVDDGLIGYDTIAAGVLDIDSKHNLPPCVQLKYIVDKIFDFAGFQLESDFLNSTEFKNIYTDGGVNGDYSNVTEYLDVNVRASSNETLTTSYADLVFDNETTDPNNLHNTSTGFYTAPANNVAVACAVSLVVQNTSSSNRTISLRLVHNSSAASAPASPYFVGSTVVAGNTTDYSLFHYAEVYLNSGETLHWEIKSSGSNCTILTSAVIPLTTPPYTARSNYYFYTNNRNDGGYEFQHNRQDIRLADIITDLTKMFNLIIEPDKDNPKKLHIEPFEDYISQGVTHDWTEKIDRSEIKQVMFDLPKKITFAMAEESDDYYLDKYKRQIGKEYGIQEVNLDVETEKTEEIRLDVFAPTAVVDMHPDYQSISVITSDGGDNGFERFSNKPRLFFKNYDFYAAPTAIFDQSDVYEGVFGAQVTSYSTSHHYEDNTGGLTTSDSNLLFGNIAPIFHDVNTVPLQTFYQKYWRTYIEERYLNLTHLLKVRVHLKSSDINRFSFKDTVRIDNQIYRVNQIDYTTGNEKLAIVELYKI